MDYRGLKKVDTMSPLPHTEYRPPHALNAALAQAIAEQLTQAIALRGQAILCVSGGKSPQALFSALCHLPLAWAHVTISLADERCVPPQHPDSNAWLVRQYLLQDQAQAAQLIPLIPNTQAIASLQQSAAMATRTMQALGRADVLVLGMGADGHMASIFPHDPQLPLALDLTQSPACLPVVLADPPQHAPYARITQNLSMLLSARQIFLPVSGSDKLAVLQRARLAQSLDLPVSYVLHQNRTPVTLWLPTQE